MFRINNFRALHKTSIGWRDSAAQAVLFLYRDVHIDIWPRLFTSHSTGGALRMSACGARGGAGDNGPTWANMLVGFHVGKESAPATRAGAAHQRGSLAGGLGRGEAGWCALIARRLSASAATQRSSSRTWLSLQISASPKRHEEANSAQGVWAARESRKRMMMRRSPGAGLCGAPCTSTIGP